MSDDAALAADEPRGLRIVHGDGRVSECSLMPDPQDAGQWIGVLPRGVLFDQEAGDRVAIDYLPDVEIRLRVPIPRPDGSPEEHRDGPCPHCDHPGSAKQP